MVVIWSDLLEANVDIIAHQVNCKGVMGAGLARQIREKYPEVYERYKDLCNRPEYRGGNSELLLGRCQIIEVNQASKPKFVLNLFAQNDYGWQGVYTDYKAFESCMVQINDFCKSFNHRLTVGMPYGIGCGLAGGDPLKTLFIISQTITDADVKLYKLSRTQS